MSSQYIGNFWEVTFLANHQRVMKGDWAIQSSSSRNVIAKLPLNWEAIVLLLSKLK